MIRRLHSGETMAGRWVVLLAMAPVAAAQPPRARPPAGAKLHADLEYVPGRHVRQRLDLYVPGKADAPLPVIVWIHGGPESQFRPSFRGQDNYLLNELGVIYRRTGQPVGARAGLSDERTLATA